MLNYFTQLTSFKEIFYKGNIKQKYHFYFVADTIKVIFFFLCFFYWRSNLFETCQGLLLLFCLNKDQFWFLFMLRTSSAEVRRKKLCREMQIARPQESYRVTKFSNERYLPYLKPCGKALMCIFMYCRCKMSPKIK